MSYESQFALQLWMSYKCRNIRVISKYHAIIHHNKIPPPHSISNLYVVRIIKYHLRIPSAISTLLESWFCNYLKTDKYTSKIENTFLQEA
mmetsp:Transcript_10251/g.30053  ORF Transcript_10251/g.30053 Transcript_10251/m.30053 type:complete len:90 (+) Transcript_10251:781-1050(+)